MCGISGVVNLDLQHEVDKRMLVKMGNTILHRGPDDKGIYTHQNIGFSFRRLSIIDLKTGHQPLANEDEKVWIVFNGEIYNFKELRTDLLQKGHVFRTQSDTETIVHLYEEYGKDCVQHLRGMFAFAIWDERNKKLFCARDRFGIKPFFYHLTKDRFVFGSEIKAVLAAGIEKEIDLSAMDSYFTYRFITDDQTIFKGIRKLKPAHSIEIQFKDRTSSDIKIEKYWNINYQPDFKKTEADWCEELNNVLGEAVKMRMISDVPLGAFLSGGIDSSIVVALMSQFTDQPIKTFSIGFKEKAFNELPFAREIAQRYQTDHFEHMVEPDSVSLLPKLAWAYDEPFADTSAIPTYYVSKFAREQVKVVLTGDGGDELFGGYDKYTRLTNIHKYNRMPHAFNKRFWRKLHDLLPNTVKGKGATYYLSKKRNEAGAYLALWTEPERKSLYRSELWDAVKNNPAENYKKQLLLHSNTDDFLFQNLELDMQSFMVDDVLTKVDRASMLNSLEARVPILDHKLAELSFTIPSNLKMNGQNKKYILKKAFEKYLPASVINHPKQGFSVPMRTWFKGSLKDYVNDRLNSRNNLLGQYLNMDYVTQIVTDHQTGMRDMKDKIWSLIFMDAWLEQYENGEEKKDYTLANVSKVK